MGIAFKEVGGSPVEKYTSEGFTAQRTFLIAWDDRDAFAVEVLGTASQYGSGERIAYPGKSSVCAVKLRYEPLDPENPDQQELFELAADLNSYRGSYAKAIVEYQTFNTRDREDGPVNEDGTHLTYRMLYGAEYETITPGSWEWTDTPGVAVPTDAELRKRIPVTEHHLTWHLIVSPPWTAISQMQGTLNNAEFLGCPAGTLLFEGADANKLFRAGLEDGPSEFAWEIRYVFRERAVKYGGNVHGWNHLYRENPAGWMDITNGSESLYESVDFTVLFESETTN